MKPEPKPLSQLVRRFRSSVSGLWYENPQAAGSIDAVELDGQILVRAHGEPTIRWIKRAGLWASEIHSKNSRPISNPQNQ